MTARPGRHGTGEHRPGRAPGTCAKSPGCLTARQWICTSQPTSTQSTCADQQSSRSPAKASPAERRNRQTSHRTWYPTLNGRSPSQPAKPQLTGTLPAHTHQPATTGLFRRRSSSSLIRTPERDTLPSHPAHLNNPQVTAQPLRRFTERRHSLGEKPPRLLGPDAPPRPRLAARPPHRHLPRGRGRVSARQPPTGDAVQV